MYPRPSELQARESDRANRLLVREWEATFRSLRDGLAVLDASARMVRVNPAFRASLELREVGLAGVPLVDVLEQAAGRPGRTAAEAALARPGRTARLRARAGWFELSVSVIEESPRVGLGFVAHLVDVTAKHELQGERARLQRRTREAIELRAEADRLASLEQMKSDLLNLVSHELRTPVTLVAGYLEMLDAEELGALPADARPVVRSLRQHIGEINVLIGEILEVTRLHEEKVELDRRELDLYEVVEQAVADAEATFATDRVRLRRAGRCAVAGDATRLRSVVVSLVGNALKFSDGEVEVAVEARGEVAAVVVPDHGIGIAEEHREKIFRRLGRVVTLENSHLRGSGLSLYTARQVARLHGGDVTVESGLGKGSTFTLTLPLYDAEAGNPRTVNGDPT